MDPQHHRPLTPLSFQILVALADAPRHGYGIIQEIEAASGERLKSSTGTVYLAIHRLEHQGFLEEESRATAKRRRQYRLTEHGRAAAILEARRLAELLRVAQRKQLIGTHLDALIAGSSGPSG